MLFNQVGYFQSFAIKHSADTILLRMCHFTYVQAALKVKFLEMELPYACLQHSIFWERGNVSAELKFLRGHSRSICTTFLTTHLLLLPTNAA